MNELEFYKELEKINIVLNDIQKEQLKIYYEYLVEYNTHTNVTSITEKEIPNCFATDSASLAACGFGLNSSGIISICTPCTS